MRSYALVEDIKETLEDPRARPGWLVLDLHSEFEGHWKVNGFDDNHKYALADVLGSYRAIAPSRLEEFVSRSIEEGYNIAFFDDPLEIMGAYEGLDKPLPFSLNSSLPDTTNGLLRYQTQGFNYLKDLRGGVPRWDTGTGKTVLAAAFVKHYQPEFDTCFFVVKKNNKENTVRKLKALAGVDALLVGGTPAQRRKTYAVVAERLYRGERGTVVVMNYEQFGDFVSFTKNDDGSLSVSLDDLGHDLFDGRDLLCIWDEMPMKMKNRTTRRYMAICKCLYDTVTPQVNWDKKRPRNLRQFMLSATPVENDPEDWFNCLPAGTEVRPLGEVSTGYRAQYKGPLVKLITASSTELSIGPNHPVLTTRGWVAAKLLNKGDHVLRCATERLSRTVEDFHQPPPLIENVFDALRAAGERVRMKGASPFEFHGDGRYFKSDIHIVGAKSPLRNITQTDGSEFLSKSALGLSLPDSSGSLFSESPPLLGNEGVSVAEPSNRSFLTPPFGSISPIGSNLDPLFSESGGNRFLANAKLTTDCGGGLTLLVEPFHQTHVEIASCRMCGAHCNACGCEPALNCGVGNSDISGDSSDGFTSVVTTDEIVSIELFEWEGHIYDLETSSGTYYANGIAVSNCVRILDPDIYGTVREFRDEYVLRYSFHDPYQPEDWHKLDKMALKAAHIVHQVDKNDPDIAAVFPKTISEPLYIDWNPEARKLYDALKKLSTKLAKDEESEGLHILSLINLFQMICDAPEMILDTAAHREVYESALEAWEEDGGRWTTKPDPEGSGAALSFVREIGKEITNVNHAKLDTLRSLITEVHPNEKVCIFTRWNAAIMPTLEASLRKWGVEYVRYEGSEKVRQAAQDRFQEDPDVRVFLSSDAGSDSIDLDAGSVVIHYDLPWKWTTYIQRQNRVHRATSDFGTVWYYTLLMADSIEDRILEIIMRKQGYHDGLFKPIAGTSASARMSKEDLRYILTGGW